MGMLLTGGSSFTLETLTQSATSVLSWFIDSMESILGFMLANPALLIWIIVSLIGAAFIFIRKLL